MIVFDENMRQRNIMDAVAAWYRGRVISVTVRILPASLLDISVFIRYIHHRMLICIYLVCYGAYGSREHSNGRTMCRDAEKTALAWTHSRKESLCLSSKGLSGMPLG